MASSITSYGNLKTDRPGLYFEQEGNKNGPAVLFIHGLGGTTNVYQPLVSSLQDYNLVRFDWAGHGRSSLTSKTSIDSYVEDAEAIIKHFNLSSNTVVSHSLGCLVAMTLAAKLPNLVSNLVLLGPIKPPPDANRAGPRDRAAKVKEGGMAAVADTIISNAFSSNSLKERSEIVAFGRELLSRQDPEGYAQACMSLAESKDPEWNSITAKTVILSGNEDKVSSPQLCQTIKQLLKNAETEMISLENVGHWHTLEDPKRCVEAIKSLANK